MTSVQMSSNQNSWVWWSVKVVKGHTCFAPKWAVLRNRTWSLKRLFKICSEIKYIYFNSCASKEMWSIPVTGNHTSLFIPFNAIGIVLWKKVGVFMSALALWVNIWAQQFPLEFEKLFFGTDICQNMQTHFSVWVTSHKYTLLKCRSMNYTLLWPKQVFVL